MEFGRDFLERIEQTLEHLGAASDGDLQRDVPLLVETVGDASRSNLRFSVSVRQRTKQLSIDALDAVLRGFCTKLDEQLADLRAGGSRSLANVVVLRDRAESARTGATWIAIRHSLDMTKLDGLGELSSRIREMDGELTGRLNRGEAEALLGERQYLLGDESWTVQFAEEGPDLDLSVLRELGVRSKLPADVVYEFIESGKYLGSVRAHAESNPAFVERLAMLVEAVRADGEPISEAAEDLLRHGVGALSREAELDVVTEDSHLLTIWNPIHKPGTIVAHIDKLLEHGHAWWGKIQKQKTTAHDIGAIDRLFRARDLPPRSLLVTDYMSLHEFRCEGVSREHPSDGAVPDYYSRHDVPVWLHVTDARCLSADQLETLRFLRDRVHWVDPLGGDHHFDPYSALKPIFPAPVTAQLQSWPERAGEPAPVREERLGRVALPGLAWEAAEQLKREYGTAWKSLGEDARPLLARAFGALGQMERDARQEDRAALVTVVRDLADALGWEIDKRTSEGDAPPESVRLRNALREAGNHPEALEYQWVRGRLPLTMEACAA